MGPSRGTQVAAVLHLVLLLTLLAPGLGWGPLPLQQFSWTYYKALGSMPVGAAGECKDMYADAGGRQRLQQGIVNGVVFAAMKEWYPHISRSLDTTAKFCAAALGVTEELQQACSLPRDSLGTAPDPQRPFRVLYLFGYRVNVLEHYGHTGSERIRGFVTGAQLASLGHDVLFADYNTVGQLTPRTPGAHSELLALLLCLCSWEYCGRLMLIACAAGSFLLLGRGAAPAWYQEGGRTLLVGALRVMPRLVALLELLLLPNPLATRAWLQACFLSPYSFLSVACLAVLLPVPLLAHAAICLLESCLFAAAVASSLWDPLPPARVVPLLMQYAFVCVLLPSTLLAAVDKCARTSFHRRRRHPPHATPYPTPTPTPPHPQPCDKGHSPAITQPTTAAGPATPRAAAAPGPAPPARPCCAPHGAHVQLAATGPGGMAGDTAATCAATSATSAAAAAALAAPRMPRPPQYQAKLRVWLTGIKIHHHDAYQHCEAIGTAVEAALLARPAAPRPPTNTPRPTLAVRTVALEGCLQLLVTVTDFPEDGPLSPGSETGTPPPSPNVLGALHQQVEACLPGWVRDTPLNIDVVTTTTTTGAGPSPSTAAPPAMPSPSALHSASASASAALPGMPALGLQHQLQQQQRRQQEVPAVQLQPLCVRAGEQEWQQLLVRPSGGSSWPLQQGGLPEVVVVCTCQGEELVLRPPPAAADFSAEGFRVHLPPDLDPAAINIHLLAPPPAPPGTLLATAATAALPSAPCAELLALPRLDGDLRHSAAALLHDLAAALHIMHVRGAACLPALRPAADDMLDFCYAAGLPACTEFLHSRLDAAANLHSPQPPRTRPPLTPPASQPPPALDPSPGAAGAATPAGIVAVANVGAAAPLVGTEPLAPSAAEDDSWPEGPAAHAPGPPVPAATNSGTGSSAATRVAVHAAAATNAVADAATAAGRGRSTCAAIAAAARLARAVAAAAGPAARLEGEQRRVGYAAWRAQEGLGEDLGAVAVCALCCVAHLGKVWTMGGLPHDAWPHLLAWTAVQLACIALPVLALSWAPGSVRGRRSIAALVQYTLRGGSYLAAARCWLVNPKLSQALIEPLPAAVLGFGVLLPALSRQAHWAVQLTAALLLEELPRYAMLQSAACPADPTPPPQRRTAGSLLQVALVPCVAAACCWLMTRRSRAAFLRLSQQAPAWRPAARRRPKAE